ncbi:hypothetical protein Tco_1423092 [Tanacetum coccineum]
MVTEMFQAFKGISTSTPSGSATVPTVTQLKVSATVGGEFTKIETIKEAKTEHVKKEFEVTDVDMESEHQPQPDRGKGKVTNDVESPPKLDKASSVVRPNPDKPAHYESQERNQKIVKEAKLLEMTKPELIKVVHEEAAKARVDPKILASAKGGQENFDVVNPFKLGDFRVTGLDELDLIIQNKKNNVVGDLMTSLGERKRKIQELEPEARILGLECNRSLSEGIPFVNNLVIEQPENEIFFITVFGNEAFQRISDIHKVDVETLLTYLVMASNIRTPKNQRFCMALRSLIHSHPDKKKLELKRVKLEAV